MIFAPKIYQSQVLDSIEAYFKACHDRWETAKDDRLIGELWAGLSGGRCRFVMVKDKRWEEIEARLQG